MPQLPDEHTTKLADAYRQRANLGYEQRQEEQAIVARQRALTPETGWKGTNPDARNAARDAAFAADESLCDHVLNRDTIKGKLIKLGGEIEALEAERRAYEWRVRERMVERLTERGVHSDAPRAARSEAAFDDVGDHALTQQYEQDGQGEPVAAAADDDYFPF